MEISNYFAIYFTCLIPFSWITIWGVLVEYPASRHDDPLFALLIAFITMLIIFFWPLSIIFAVIYLFAAAFRYRKKGLNGKSK